MTKEIPDKFLEQMIFKKLTDTKPYNHDQRDFPTHSWSMPLQRKLHTRNHTKQNQKHSRQILRACLVFDVRPNQIQLTYSSLATCWYTLIVCGYRLTHTHAHVNTSWYTLILCGHMLIHLDTRWIHVDTHVDTLVDTCWYTCGYMLIHFVSWWLHVDTHMDTCWYMLIPFGYMLIHIDIVSQYPQTYLDFWWKTSDQRSHFSQTFAVNHLGDNEPPARWYHVPGRDAALRQWRGYYGRPFIPNGC